MDVTRQEAEDLLAEAERTERLVQRQAPKEYIPFFVWGLFHLLVIPGFDFFSPEAWGWVTIAVAAGAVIATCWYFARGNARVRVRDRSPWWAWPVLSVGGGLVAAMALAFDEQLRVPYTVAGVLIAVPLLIWGAHLRRTA
jgi:undecaprenyl pyrophosphate phosphatase UppP